MAWTAPVPHPKPNAPIAPTITIHKYSLITAIVSELYTHRMKKVGLCVLG